jgi:hypothetical protein
MTNLHLIGNEMASEPSYATEPSVVDSSTQQPATPTALATPELPFSSPAEARTEPETLTEEKAPASSPNRAAARKPVAKKVSKAKSAKPVPSKSPAKKAASKKTGGKAPGAQKKSSAWKGTAKKSAVKAAAAKKTKATTAVKKTAVKKTVAKKALANKSGPVKARAAKTVVAPPQAPKAAAPVPPTKPVKVASSHERAHDAVKAKSKLVRDSFTMPEQDFGLIAVLKERALEFKRPTKKSELLRAGLHALQHLGDAQLRGALDSLMPLKAGRPKKKGN